MTDWRDSTGKSNHSRGGRTVDMQTGGIVDDVGGALGGAYDTVAGAADWTFGEMDEAFHRSFDDKPGGGLLDGLVQTIPFMDQPESVTQRQVDEGILDDSSLESSDVSGSSASIRRSDNTAPPGGSAVQIVRVRNGLAHVSKSNPNRRQTDKQDVVSPEGAIIGIGAAAAGAAAAGASLGSVAGPPGMVVGALAGGAGSLLASEVEEFVGALGYTITAFIDGNAVGQTVASVGVPAGGVGSNGRNVQLEHTVPQEPGQYTIEIVVSMWQTGEVVDTMEVDMTVEEGRESSTVDDSDGGGNGAGSNKTVAWVMDNPVKAAGIGLTSLVFVRTATETAISGD